MVYKPLSLHVFNSLILPLNYKAMNVDKFGHHVHKRLRVSEVSELKHKALFRSENGDYDLHSARLKGVLKPLSPDEAANKQYVDQLLQNTYQKKHVDSLFEVINSQIIQLSTQLKLNFYTNKEIDKILENLKNDKRTNRERNP